MGLQRAICVSVLIHLLLLAAGGGLLFGTAPVLQASEYIELDLAPSATPGRPEGSAEREGRSSETPATRPFMAVAAASPVREPVLEESAELVQPAEDTAVSDLNRETRQEPAVRAFSPAPVSGDQNDQNMTSAQSGTGSNANNGSGSGMKYGNGSSALLPPRILQRVEPRYPEAARRQNVEGTVMLQVEIFANGLPGELTILQSSGSPLLDQAAENAVKRWRFVPARDVSKGIAIRCYTTIPIVFNLH